MSATYGFPLSKKAEHMSDGTKIRINYELGIMNYEEF